MCSSPALSDLWIIHCGQSMLAHVVSARLTDRVGTRYVPRVDHQVDGRLVQEVAVLDAVQAGLDPLG